MKHVIDVSDGDIVELRPRRPGSSTDADSPNDAGQVRVTLNCVPPPTSDGSSQDADTQGFIYSVASWDGYGNPLPLSGGSSGPYGTWSSTGNPMPLTGGGNNSFSTWDDHGNPRPLRGGGS